MSKTNVRRASSVPGIDLEKEQKLLEIFNRVDEDGSGSIDVNELLNMLQNTSEKAHIKNSPGQVVKMMDQIDTSRNGMVSCKEFVAAFASLSLVREYEINWDLWMCRIYPLSITTQSF